MPLPGFRGPSGQSRIRGLKGALAPSQARVRTTWLSGREYACVCSIKQQNSRFLKKGLLRALLEPLAPPFLSLRPCVERAGQEWLSRTFGLSRVLGYMDTLVHFGRFSLAPLGKAEIDSWLVAN